MAESIVLQTAAADWQLARATNTTDASFPARFRSATRPSGTGNSVAQATASAVIDNTGDQAGGTPVQNSLIAMPCGVGADNNTGSMRIGVWSRVPSKGTPDTEIYIYMLLCEVLYTVSGSLAGLAGRKVDDTQLFADTITLVGTSGNAGIDIDIVSPANDTPAHVVVDLKGGEIPEITFARGSSLTSCNALVRMM